MGSNNAKFKTSIWDVFQIVFLTLKLAGLVDWSWWFVFVPYMISFSILIFAGLLAIAAKALESK